MSVFKEATFKTDTPRILAKNWNITNLTSVKGLFDYTYKDKYLNFSQNPYGHTYKDLQENIIDPANLGLNDGQKANEFYESHLLEPKSVYIGLKAIYDLVLNIRNGEWSTSENDNSAIQLSIEMATVASRASQVNPGRFVTRMSELITQWANNMYEIAAKEFTKIIGLLDSKQAREYTGEDDEAYVPKLIISSQMWKILIKNELMFIVGSTEYANKTYVYNRRDLNKLVQLLRALSSSEQLMQTSNPVEYNKVMEFHYYVLARVNRDTANNVTEYFDLIHTLITRRRYDVRKDVSDLEKEAKNHELYKVAPFEKYAEYLASLDVVIMHQLLDLYKLYPSPDFCVISARSNIQPYHDTPNKVGGEIDEEHGAIYKEIRDRDKLDYIRLYQRTYHRNPGTLTSQNDERNVDYTLHKNVKIKKQDLKNVSITGTMRYLTAGRAYYRLLKDRTIAPQDETQAQNAKDPPPFQDRNTLGYMLKSPDSIDTNQLLKSISSIPRHVIYKFKPEAKKPKSRLFYMSTIKSRLVKQELESNVRHFLKKRRGNAMGVEPITLATEMSRLTNLKNYFSHNYSKMLLISFDLRKFSPQYGIKAMEDNKAFWADIFNRPEIKDITNLTRGTTVIQNQSGTTTSYTMNGVDFEGDSGAQNTWYHISVMSTAIEYLKQEELILGKAELKVFIDDGILGLTIPYKFKVVDIEKIMAIIMKVYRAAGWEVHPRKTLISYKAANFLNDWYYNGHKIPVPYRSFTKIQPDPKVPAISVTERCREIFSKAQAAAADGSRWDIVYAKYLYEVAKILLSFNYSMKCPNEILAMTAFAHPHWGGLGVAGMHQLLTTASHDARTASLSILKLAATYFPKYRRWFMNYLNAPKMKVHGVAWLHNPSATICGGYRIREDRLTAEIMKKINEPNFVVNPEFLEILAMYSKFDVEAFAKEVQTMDGLNTVMIDLLYKTTPHYTMTTYLAKFKRASSLVPLLGYGLIGRIRKKNIDDYANVLKQSMAWW